MKSPNRAGQGGDTYLAGRPVVHIILWQYGFYRRQKNPVMSEAVMLVKLWSVLFLIAAAQWTNGPPFARAMTHKFVFSPSLQIIHFTHAIMTRKNDTMPENTLFRICCLQRSGHTFLFRRKHRIQPRRTEGAERKTEISADSTGRD